MTPLRVGMLGLGTVAQGVLKLLAENRSIIERRAGRPIRVTEIASRRARPEVDLGGAKFSTDLERLVASDEIDVLLELIGGETTALDLVRKALGRGRSVVTGNKAIVALHGNELMPLARARGAHLGFEAAVAGGIPIIASLTESLAGNEHQWLAGIINGTSNFVLTAMTERDQSFADALQEAQRLGYAEADPTFDVEGIDAAHKLAILNALAFDIDFRFADIYTEGIADVAAEDIGYARQLGYRIKHLGLSRRHDGGIEARVHPVLIPESHLLAGIDGAMNAVMVHSDAAGDTLYCGAGAGQLPTASAVIADLIDLAKGTARLPEIGVLFEGGAAASRIVPMDEVETAYYLRIPSLDRPGAFAHVATVLSEHDISIEAAIQRERPVTQQDTNWVAIVILTHEVREAVMNRALAAVQALPDVVERITRIRVEHLGTAAGA